MFLRAGKLLGAARVTEVRYLKKVHYLMTLSGPLHTLVWPFQAVTTFPRILTTFWYLKVWPGSGSAWIRIGLAPWIRIRIIIEIKSWIRIRIDPHHCKNGYSYSSGYYRSFQFWPVFWICDILVRIMIRIRIQLFISIRIQIRIRIHGAKPMRTQADPDSFKSKRV